MQNVKDTEEPSSHGGRMTVQRTHGKGPVDLLEEGQAGQRRAKQEEDTPWRLGLGLEWEGAWARALEMQSREREGLRSREGRIPCKSICGDPYGETG